MCTSCRASKMLSNAYLLAKIGADTAENDQHFAENLPIGRRVADRRASSASFRRRRVLGPRRSGRSSRPRWRVWPWPRAYRTRVPPAPPKIIADSKLMQTKVNTPNVSFRISNVVVCALEMNVGPNVHVTESANALRLFM